MAREILVRSWSPSPGSLFQENDKTVDLVTDELEGVSDLRVREEETGGSDQK